MQRENASGRRTGQGMHRCTAALTAALLLSAGLLGVAPRAALAQDTPVEVRVAARQALAQGLYVDAILYLNQLVAWFSDSRVESIIQEMEGVYFNLGLCHLLLGQFDECRRTYETYLVKYRRGARAHLVAAYIADTHRYEEKFDEALRAYRHALRTYDYNVDVRSDILLAKVRCHLAEDRWVEATPLLAQLYQIAPDFRRRNWAATMLTTAYLKDLNVDQVYRMVPMLIAPGSFSAYSVALNVAALEAGDYLFDEERYRDALWIYRLIYPHDVLMMNALQRRDQVNRRIEFIRRIPGDVIRELLRLQEMFSEMEAEIAALEQVPNYDGELFFRIARSYFETRRNREASELFYDLYLDGPRERAEECLYLSFLAATRFQPLDRAFARGAEYMEVYPGGEYYDPVSLALGTLYANVRDWPEVIRVFNIALEVSPNHEDLVECLFLRGYAHFMEEFFGESVDDLVRMNTEFPGNERESDGTYWTGMALLFDKKYEEGLVYFDRVVEEFRDSIYIEDAEFRAASCSFGLSEYEEAERRLLRWLSRYPESHLTGEAYLILGDISGQFGELDEAIRRYRRALDHEDQLHVEFYNHVAFRTGEILSDVNRYEDLIAHFRRYMERDREGSNVPQAIYWIGHGHWELNERERALAFFQRAIDEFGRDRDELGVDLIFEEWVGRTRRAGPELEAEAWQNLRALLRRTQEEGARTLSLRVLRMLRYDPDASEREREVYLGMLLREDVLPYASAGVLETIIHEAEKAGNHPLARAAAREMIETYTETDYALAARTLLSREAIAAEDYPEAILHLNVIREVFATSDEAGEALLQLGDIYLAQRRMDEADEAFRDVLGVRGWRNLWPPALYGRGEVARARRRFDQASAYYERIYLLYAAHREWAARAYVARAECLARLFEYRGALQTLQEMMAQEDLAALPEAERARELMESYRRRS